MAGMRARWLVGWIQRALVADKVAVADMSAVFGRLGFSAGPFERVRPFSSILYTWVAAVPMTATLKSPDGMKLILVWMKFDSKPASECSLTVVQSARLVNGSARTQKRAQIQCRSARGSAFEGEGREGRAGCRRN